METQLRSQPLGIGQLLGEGWKLYRANFKNILLIVLCVYIPVNFILSFIPADYLVDQFGAMRGLQLYSNIISLLQFFIGIIATIGIAALVEKAVQSTIYSWRDALQHGLSRWGTAIGTGILTGIILFGLTMLLIVPGIIWSIYYTFWVYIVALRDTDGKKALDYSKRLVKGQWWGILGTMLVIYILGFVIGLLSALPFTFLPEIPFFSIITDTLSDIIAAYFTVVTAMFFLNNDYRRSPAPLEASPLTELVAEI